MRFKSEMTKMKRFPVLFLLLFSDSGFAKEKDKTVTIVEKYDAPILTTFYFPSVIAQAKDEQTKGLGRILLGFQVKPYIGAKNGQVWLRLYIEPTLGEFNQIGYAFEDRVDDLKFVVDGQEFSLSGTDCDQRRNDRNSHTYVDCGGAQLEPAFRKVSTATDAYLIIFTGQHRYDIHLDKEVHKIPFRLITEKYDSLIANAKPGN